MTERPRVVFGTTAALDSSGRETEHPVVAADIGGGSAICVTLDKNWTLRRSWDEIKVKDEYVVYSPEFPQEQQGWRAVLREIAGAKHAAATWEDQFLDERARHDNTKRELEALKEGFEAQAKATLEEKVLARYRELVDLVYPDEKVPEEAQRSFLKLARAEITKEEEDA